MTPESPTPPPADQPPNDTSGIKIHNWSDAKDPIGDNTELVRYMKLETFLLILNSRVFIPTLGCLAATDRLESRIPQRFHGHNYPEAMKQVVKDHEEWLEQVATSKQMPTNSDYPTDQKLRFLTETWLYELGQRRLVWCWNRWTYEQHAMWRFYGQRGVAIHSTVGAIRRALARAGADGSVSPAKYVYQGVPKNREQKDAFLTLMLMPKYLFHPYLFKDAGFRFEEEVRFVLRGNPAVTSRSNGALLDIAATDLIRGTGFDVSEELPHSEQGLIRLLGIDFLQHGLTLPSFPVSSSGLFGLAPSNPFTIEPDLPTGLFRNLD
ncbi:MAG: hypothetical protein WB696_29960 [Chthoniobacterales bacterium]